MSEIWKPKDFQDEGRRFLFDRKAAALWWRMGRGKTVTTATACVDLLDLEMASNILVVAPKRVATQTWPNEFKKWKHLRGQKWSLITGNAKQRRAAVEKRADFYFVNWENLHWLKEEYFLSWKWDVVVLDESSKVKSQSTRNYKTVKALRMAKKIHRLYELTGSPAPNGLKDVWAPIYLMDKGRRLGRTEDAYRKRWFFSDYDGQLRPRGNRSTDEINDRLSDVVYALRSAITANDPIFNRVEIELPLSVMRDYRDLETQAFLELESGDKVDAVNAAAVTGKLLQFASGGVYTEYPEWVQVHTKKMEALDDIVEEAAGDPIIVAYGSRHERERILRAYPQAVAIDDAGDTLEEDWNAKRIPILVMHPGSGGHGLNLQFGGATIVWFSLLWNLEHFEQLIARLHGRHGQTRDVIVHMLIAQGTIDMEADLRLMGKASVQEALMIAQERRRKSK